MRKKMVGNIWKKEYRSVIPHLSPLFFPLCAEFRREKVRRWSTLAHRSLRNLLTRLSVQLYLRKGGGVFRDRRVSRSVLSRLESRQIARQIEGATIFDEISYPQWKLMSDSRIVFEARVSRQIVYRVKYRILTFRFYIVKAGLYFIYTI